MSEYTSYAVVHVDNLKATCDELTMRNITSVLMPEFKHPLFNSKEPEKEWNFLPYKDKWLMLMAKDINSNGLGFLPLSVYLKIDEDTDRWSLKLYKNGEILEFLFSDFPWGDMCAADRKDDIAIIDDSKNIKDSNLIFMEELFQVKRDKFLKYLKTGNGMVFNFLEAVALPEFYMECDWQFYYPKKGNNRCMLWNEFIKLVD